MMRKWAGRNEFKEKVYLYANEIKIGIKQVAIRPMTRKWASCSTSGYLNFNVELLDIDQSLGEYVILHELLHYHVPNHGKLWKSLMMAYMPDHEERSLQLKSRASLLSLVWTGKP